jgi:hypothetical protein
MPGPLKKEPSLVARRNKPPAKTVLKPPAEPVVPALPKGTRWYPQVQEWWTRAWSSPMAKMWADSDRDAMFLALRLQQQFWDPKTSASTRNQTAAQIQGIFDKCGLTPLARHRLGWEIEAPGPPETGTSAPAKKAAAPKTTDPRTRRFQVVN